MAGRIHAPEKDSFPSPCNLVKYCHCLTNTGEGIIIRSEYDAKNRDWLLAWHGRICAAAPESTPALAAFSRQVQEILGEIPYIGGEENQLTTELRSAAAWLALRQCSQHSLEELENLMTRAFLAGTQHLSQEQLEQARNNWFSAPRMAGLARMAERSQERRHPGDWVFSLVSRIDAYELTYTECGICKFFSRAGQPELAPLFCRGDYRTSKLLGLGLVRTKTIAGGDECCDFHYKLGRETQTG